MMSLTLCYIIPTYTILALADVYLRHDDDRAATPPARFDGPLGDAARSGSASPRCSVSMCSFACSYGGAPASCRSPVRVSSPIGVHES